MIHDLHTHTNASDGTLTPDALVQRAIDLGIDVLAITDHDTIAAHHSLPDVSGTSLRIVPGIEFSSRWMKIGVHLVGLNVDLGHATLLEGIERQREARLERASRIGARLQKVGVADPLPHVTAIAGDATIGRPHFAKYLVEAGYVKDFSAAFRKYLGAGKPGDVRDIWPSLAEVVAWIRACGGTAVLAHPAHYKLTATRLRALVHDFTDAGGHAIEVVSGRQHASVTAKLAELSVDHGLAASCGSDFHGPGSDWSELGRFAALPANVTPVWESWD